MVEINEDLIEKYGELKAKMEMEGDGYFFYGYGLPKEHQEDAELSILFEAAENAIDKFKTVVEKRIIDNGGNPEDWEA